MSERLRTAAFNLVIPASVFSILVNMLMLTGPLFMLQIYDRVLSSRSIETLVALLLLVLGLYFLMWLLDFSRVRVLARVGARLQRRLDAQALRETLKRGESLKSVPRDLEIFQGFTGSSAMTALLDLPFTPAFVAVIFVLHPWLGWLALAGGATLILITALNEWLTVRKRQSAQKLSENARIYADSLARNCDVIKAQGMTDAVTRNWVDIRNSALVGSLAAEDLTSLLGSLIKAARLALQSVILALGAWLVLAGDITPGAMIAASILLGRALAPVEQVLSRWPHIRRAVEAWNNIRSLTKHAGKTGPATTLPAPRGHLHLAGVTLSGGPGTPALLYNIGFVLEPGQALGIIGKSGAGKSTLAKVLVGLVRPTVGEVRLSGALPSHYGEMLGRHIGYLPQVASLLPGTVSENIARMASAPNSGKVVAAAQAAGAHELILGLPQGYDTLIDPGAIHLSGGQIQRIALARALFDDPALMVLDEPNSWLDGDGTEAMNAAVRAAKSRGAAVIIMTHRPQAIAECDQLLVLDKGKMISHGTRENVLKSLMRNNGTISFSSSRRAIA